MSIHRVLAIPRTTFVMKSNPFNNSLTLTGDLSHLTLSQEPQSDMLTCSPLMVNQTDGTKSYALQYQKISTPARSKTTHVLQIGNDVVLANNSNKVILAKFDRSQLKFNVCLIKNTGARVRSMDYANNTNTLTVHLMNEQTVTVPIS